MGVLLAVAVTAAVIYAALWGVVWLFGMMFGFRPGESARATWMITGALFCVFIVVAAVVVLLSLVWSGVS